MGKTVKKAAAGLAAVFLVAGAMYLEVRPLAVEKLEPILEQTARDRINGTLSWEKLDLDPSLNLEFQNIILRDVNGAEVFRAPSLTVGWTIPRAFSAWKSGDGAASAISEVVLDAPSMHLEKLKNGSWNVQNLLKPQKEPQKNPFSGRILLRNGVAFVAPGNGETYELQGLGGQFSWLKAGEIDGRLDGMYAGSGFQASLVYKNDHDFQGELQTGALPLSLASPFLKDLPDGMKGLSIKDGTVAFSSAKVWQRDGTMTYHVSGKLYHGGASLDGYDLTNGTADFDIYDGSADLTNLRGYINGALITGSAHLSWKEELAIDGMGTVHQGQLEQLLPGRDLAGRVSGSIHVTGAISSLKASGHALLTDGMVHGIFIQRAETDASWDGDTLSLTGANARLADGEMEGNGTYRFSTGYFHGEGEARNVPLALFAPDGSLSGIVTGRGTASGYAKDGEIQLEAAKASGMGQNLSYGGYSAGTVSGELLYDGARYKARFYGENLSDGNFIIDSAAGEGEGDPSAWTVNYLNGTAGNGAFSLRGSYSKEAMDFQFQAAGIDAAPLSSYLGEPLSGTLSVSGKITGSVDRPVADLSFSGRDGTFRNAEIRRISGHAVSDGEWLRLDGVHMDTETGSHSLSGRIGLAGPHALDLHETSLHTRIENLLHLAGSNVPVTGWINNETFIRGTLTHPEVSGRFLAWDGSVAGELYQSVSADYTVHGETLQIANGLAYIYGGAATASGTVSADALDLDLSLVDVSVDRMARNLPVKGKATFRGHLSGTPYDPEFRGYAESRSISIGKASVEQVSAGLYYKDHVFEVTDGYFRQHSGKFQWSGLIHSDTGLVSGKLFFTDWDVGEACRLFQLPVQQVSGAMNGSLLLEGTLDDPNVSLNVGLNGGSLGGIPMGQGKVDLSYVNHQLSVREFRIPVGNGLLAAKGTMDGNERLNMDIAANQMDLSWIPAVTGMKNITLGGKLTAGIALRGSREKPVADVSVGIDHPSYNGIDFDSLSLMGNIADGAFRIDQALITKDVYKASASGTMPASFITRVPGDRDVPFDIDVNLDNADLNALVFFAKPVTSASGPIRGHVKISGPWDDPAANGNIRVDQGTLTLSTLGEPVDGISGHLQFNGKSLSFQSAAAIGGGSLSAAGMLDWDHAKLTGYSGEAHLHAPRLNSTYYKGTIDADFTAGEERGLPKIEGTVDIRNATVDIPLSFEESSGSPDVLMDVSVNVGDGVRLYNSLLYDMYIRGNIHAMGLVSKPIMSGRVNVEKGTVRYLSNEFNVTEGNAVWGGVPDSFLPILNIAADTMVGHYDIGMELKGPPGNFQFKLHSEPALSDSQIVTLLTLRQAPGSAENDATTGALFNAGLQMAFSGGVENFLKDSFGLDVLSVTTSLTDYYDSSSANMRNDYYYVKLGKYLFNNFMLTATMGINNDEQSIGFRYDLKSRIGLVAWYNSDHDSYVGMDYQFRF